jgi:hypothetical protein
MALLEGGRMRPRSQEQDENHVGTEVERDNPKVGYRRWFRRWIVRDQLQQYAIFCSLAAGSTQKVFKDLRGKKEMFMHIALGTAFGMIAAAPFVGRWRANVWLKKNMSQAQVVSRIAEIA